MFAMKESYLTTIKGSQDSKEAQAKRIAAQGAHRRLFNVIASLAPTFGTGIGTILTNVEQVADLAARYECIHRVRPYLNTQLFNLGGDLYPAIAQGPPRWLRLSVPLETPAVFKEALIHCAGGFPAYEPWRDSLNELGPALQKIVLHKAMLLKTWTDRVYLELFKLDFEVPKSEETASPCPASIQAVNIFQQWLAAQLREISPRAGAPHQSATVIRALSAGGDAYLKRPEVVARLEKTKRRSAAETALRIQQQITAIKQFAKELAVPLTKNCLMIDPIRHDIPYLTCTEVAREDWPWLKQQAQTQKQAKPSRADPNAESSCIVLD